MGIAETGKAHNSFKRYSLVFGIIVSVIALVICGFGIWLVYLKSSGKTNFKLFGQEFKSDNTGVAAIFIGAVVLIFALRRTFKSLDYITGSYQKVASKIWDSDVDPQERER